MSQMWDRRSSTCDGVGWYYSQKRRDGVWLIQFECVVTRGRRTASQISWEACFLLRNHGLRQSPKCAAYECKPEISTEGG